MFCSKCGKDNIEGSKFCNGCGNALPGQTVPVSFQPPPGMPVGSNTPVKPAIASGKKKKKWWLIPVVVITVLIIAVFALGGEDDYDGDKADSAQQNDDYMVDSDQDNENDQDNKRDNDTDPTEEGVASDGLSDLLSMASNSTSATCELVRDTSQFQYLTDEELAILKETLIPANFSEGGYAFLFNPEYRIILDNGVSFVVMQDTATKDHNLSVVRFDGDDTIYTANYEVFKACNIVQTERPDDYSYMHIFEDGTDLESAIDAVVKGGDLGQIAAGFVMENGFSESYQADPYYRIDYYEAIPMEEVSPNLYALYIQYSIVPEFFDGVENSPIFYENDGWLSGGTMVGAVYVDVRDIGARAYPIGMQGMVLDVNETSPFEIALEYYQNSQVENLFQ